jgi:hypothetical protein
MGTVFRAKYCFILAVKDCSKLRNSPFKLIINEDSLGLVFPLWVFSRGFAQNFLVSNMVILSTVHCYFCCYTFQIA